MKKTGMQTIVFLASFVMVLTLVGSVARGGIVFRDDFEDGSATDGAPVIWTPVPSATGSFEVIDGDFVLTRPRNIEEMYCYVDKYMTLADTSIRTQARLIPGAWWFGLFARGNLGEGLYIALLFNNGKLEIWRFGASAYVGANLASANIGIDPSAQDVLLRFDVIGNELSAWAWREGDPMPAEPQVTAMHSEFATGGVGIGADLGSRFSNNGAIFRYVEVYERTKPTSDFNGDGIVDAADMCMMVDYWGEDYPPCDIGPEPRGDGIVDVQDLIVLAEHLFDDYRAIAQWKLDEKAGNVAYDSVGWYDATIYGEPIWQPASGQIAGALELDGIDDYVETDFVLDPADGAFSVFAWIKGGAPGQVIISQSDGTGSGETWLGMDAVSGCLMAGLVPPRAGWAAPQPLVSESIINDDQWRHIGFVWDGSYRALYTDGIEVAKDTYTKDPLKNADGGLYIGADKTLGAGTFFSGLIDDVRIYNQALSAEDIEALVR